MSNKFKQYFKMFEIHSPHLSLIDYAHVNYIKYCKKYLSITGVDARFERNVQNEKSCFPKVSPMYVPDL